VICAAVALGQTNVPKTPEPKLEAESEDRTTLNLLGKEDSSTGEAKRNENVSLVLIDNNVLKELNQRMGTTATIVEAFSVERSYFGKEYGGALASSFHLSSAPARAPHGEVNWSHTNSVFNARSFFQVGPVQPARSNDYGVVFSTKLWSGGSISLNAGQRKLRGMVNGNVLVPAANERTPTTTDPATRIAVLRLLSAYPAQLPNRTDINPRALNLSAPQNINDNRASGTLDQSIGSSDRVTMRYNLTLQHVEAFQLIGGQNPDTDTKNHDARVTWTRSWNSATTSEFSAGFSRIRSLLLPEDTAIDHVYLFQRIIETIGPGSNIPVNRAINTSRLAGRVRHHTGSHSFTFGGELGRKQVNGSDSNDHRGAFQFRRDFGREMSANILAGTPSFYRQSIGSAHRGFRQWAPILFFGDDWKAAANLTVNFGVRYEPGPRPVEVNHLTELPYNCDCNNLAPTFGFAYKLKDKWGLVRGAYAAHYGEIFAVTYTQARFNAPRVINVNIPTPLFTDPLRGVTIDSSYRGDAFRIDPELTTPYSHQYNFNWELRPFGSWVLDLGYVGSRTHKLFSGWFTNRAQLVAGISPTTGNINARRPDSKYTEVLYIHNPSNGWYDAGKVTLRMPRYFGLNMDTSYWWSKALDQGGDYTNTAYGQDARQNRAPTEFHVLQRMKGWSNFDQPHALMVNVVYETPHVTKGSRAMRRLFGSWQFAAVALWKVGTPFNVETGSDSPGFGNVDGIPDDRPNVVNPAVLGMTVDHPDKSRAQLPKSAFAFPSLSDASGNLGRNTFRKDGIGNVNASLSRTFALHNGTTAVHFRAESLNLTNHAQFEEPGSRLSEENFAQITNTLNDGRAFRFALRLTF